MIGYIVYIDDETVRPKTQAAAASTGEGTR